MAWSQVHDELVKKVNQEMAEYEQQMQSMPGSYVYAHADEISSMKFCYGCLMDNIRSYQVRDLEPLLQYDKPLELLHGRWSVEQNYDPSEEFGRIIYDPDYDPDYGDEHIEPQSGMGTQSMC